MRSGGRRLLRPSEAQGTLLASPLWRPLLKERSGTFGIVARVLQDGLSRLGIAAQNIIIESACRSNNADALPHRQRRICTYFSGERGRNIKQIRQRRDPIDHPHRQCSCGINGSAGSDHFHGKDTGKHPRKAIKSAGRGDQPAFNFGQPERRTV